MVTKNLSVVELMTIVVLMTGCPSPVAVNTSSPDNTPSSEKNATLSSLLVSNGTMNPLFTAATESYAAMFIGSSSVTVTPTAEITGATITVNDAAVLSGGASDALPLAPGSNTITVIVTAKDGVTKKTYTVTAGRIDQEAYIKASNTEANDGFGYSVSLSGDTLAVGAYGEASYATGVNGDQGDNGAARAGAVYILH